MTTIEKGLKAIVEAMNMLGKVHSVPERDTNPYRALNAFLMGEYVKTLPNGRDVYRGGLTAVENGWKYSIGWTPSDESIGLALYRQPVNKGKVRV